MLPLLYQSPPTPAPGSTSIIGFDATRDDGQVISFIVNGSSIIAPPGVKLRLEQTVSGYTLTDASDNIETYGSDGKLLSITSRGGVMETLNYGGSAKLSSVVDSFGQSFALSYDGQGRLVSVMAPDSSTGEYGFDTQDRLETVTYQDSTTRTYLYENTNFQNAITGLIDENDSRVSTWTYDAQGRAIRTEEAGGAGAVTLVYNPDGSVTTTDAFDAVCTFQFGRYGDRNLLTGISGSQCPTCREGKATTLS